MKKLPKSPVTGNSNVRILDEFLTADIIELYRLQENVDVEPYLRHGDKVELLECMDTGYRFYYPLEVIGDEAFYKKLQSEHEARSEEYDRNWSQDHQLAFEQIKPEDAVLEVGCNSGKFLKKVSEKTPNTLGLEFNLTAAEKARQKGLNILSETIEKHVGNNAEKYDVACAFQVLEHIAEIQSFLSSLLKTLKPGGKLIFSVPNNEPFYQRFSKYEVLNMPPHHVGLWDLHSFQKLCDFYDMELISHTMLSPSPLKIDVYLRAKMFANVKSSPVRHTIKEKLKIITMAPFAFLRSSFDYLGTNPNHAHILVVFQKDQN